MQQQKVEYVKVAVRCRPLMQYEFQSEKKQIVEVSQYKGEIKLHNNKNDSTDLEKVFTFDTVFDTIHQAYVYQETAYPIVESVLEGYNGTILAYGQCCSGRTFTMKGGEPKHERGIIIRSFEHVFRVIEETPKVQFVVRASYMELYNEEIRDLLSKSHLIKMELREKPNEGVYVKDLSCRIVKSVADLQKCFKQGVQNSITGNTQMNNQSSKSHKIFTITVESYETTKDNEQRTRVGKLNLVDLAGGERQQKTQATGIRQKEAILLNNGLTTLGIVITSLSNQKAQHIPYRDSKLTRLLQDSLGGNTKTVLIAHISPTDYEDNLITLKLASLAKNIKNKPKINDAVRRDLQDEVARLKDELANRNDGQQIQNDLLQGNIIQKEQLAEDGEPLSDEIKRRISNFLNFQDEQQRSAPSLKLNVFLE